MGDECTPPELREGIRTGIVGAVRRDFELRGGRTVQLLLVAGVIGVAGAVGITLLVAGHPFGHHPRWHVVVFSAVWAGLLVVSLAIVLLQLRTPFLPLARAASIGVAALALAGVCGALCPDPHFLRWWERTAVGSSIASVAGVGPGAACFGIVTSALVALGAALLLPGDREEAPLRPLLPGTMVLVLLAPGIALQSVGTSWGVLLGWLAGAALGSQLGVASGIRLRSRSLRR